MKARVNEYILMGLGYLSKGIEIVLIIALIVDIWNIARQRASPTAGSASPQMGSGTSLT